MYSKSEGMTELQPLMLIGRPKAAAMKIEPTVQAAPPMSALILSMFADGLIEMPPESKVTPFPK